MNVSIQRPHTGLTRLKLFFALSRTPHGLLDVATPALAALLWLGEFPPLRLVALGLVTAFAGYTAVYALNDLIDYRVDREKTAHTDPSDSGNYLDALLVRHPVAVGLLSPREGFLWAAAWALLALVGAYLLNPICVLIFLIGCLLEGLYCLMLKVSHLRTIVSGAVKTSGGIAAVFAVDPNPSFSFLIVLFLWLFFWEIGGQNIPNDWADLEEDSQIQAKTIPVRFGPEGANIIIFGSLILAVVLNIVLYRFTQASLGLPFEAASLLAGLFLLIIPAYRLHKSKERELAMRLFDRASYYPLALLSMFVIKLLI